MTGLRHLPTPLLAVMLLAGCASEVPERVVERRITDVPADRGAALLRSAMLGGHARERGAVGVAPLIWNDGLAGDARAYAEQMARTGRFSHSDQPQGPAREGENLWTGTRGAYAYAEMFGHWAAEKRGFVNRPTPAFSRTGRWEEVAHYSQVVSRRSTFVGCALASGASDDFLVCRYAPAGNLVGEPVY